MKLTFLGTGTSVGVPFLGCSCDVCTSSDARDSRLRCSAVLEANGVRVLLDCGPDFRAQALRHHLTHLDAVLLTHEHYDHVGGLDDIRPLGEAHVYAEKRVLDAVQRVMPYCFGEKKYPGSPKIALHEVCPLQPLTVASPDGQLEIIPLRVMHNKLPILGYRIGGLAYITDASLLPEETLAALQGVQTLVLNALQWPTHPAHLSLEESISLAQQIGAERTFFTHFSHKIGLHADTEACLPRNMHLAYDNLEITL